MLSRNSCQQLEAGNLLEQATVGLYLYAIHIQGGEQDRTPNINSSKTTWILSIAVISVRKEGKAFSPGLPRPAEERGFL